MSLINAENIALKYILVRRNRKFYSEVFSSRTLYMRRYFMTSNHWLSTFHLNLTYTIVGKLFSGSVCSSVSPWQSPGGLSHDSSRCPAKHDSLVTPSFVIHRDSHTLSSWRPFVTAGGPVWYRFSNTFICPSAGRCVDTPRVIGEWRSTSAAMQWLMELISREMTRARNVMSDERSAACSSGIRGTVYVLVWAGSTDTPPFCSLLSPSPFSCSTLYPFSTYTFCSPNPARGLEVLQTPQWVRAEPGRQTILVHVILQINASSTVDNVSGR